MDEASNNVAVASGTNGSSISNIGNELITGGLVAPVYPHVCPGCGRCRDCGHPYPNSTPYQSPFWPPYQSPFWPPPYSQPIVTCGPNTGIVQTGTVALNATNSTQS